MTAKLKLFAASAAIAVVALPVSGATAHHSDRDDYKLVELPTLKLVDFSPQRDNSATPNLQVPQVQSPVEVNGPQIKVYRRTYVQGGPGLLGLKVSCKSITGTACSGKVAIGRNGRLASRPFRLTQPQPQLLRVKLSRGTLSKLVWYGRLTVGMTITANDELGNASVTTGQLTLVRVR